MTYWLQTTLPKPTKCSSKPSCYYWNLHLQFCNDSCRSVPEMFSLVYAAAPEVAFHLHIKANRKNTSSATTRVQKYFKNICACTNSAEELGMLPSSEPASQNWPAKLMHTTSQICWKSTPAPSADGTIVLLPSLQPTALTLPILMLLLCSTTQETRAACTEDEITVTVVCVCVC